MGAVESGLPWADSYDPVVPLNLKYPEVTLCDLLWDTVAKNPEHSALIYFGKTVTYGDLYRHVASLAGSLKELKLGRGDKIAIILPNCPQYVISYYACLQIGATVIPINPLSTETELLYIFKDSAANGVISLDLLAGRVEGVRDKLKDMGESDVAKHVFYTSLKDFMPFPKNLLYPFKQKLSAEAKARLTGSNSYLNLLGKACGPLAMSEVDLHKDVAVLIYTGGTTGKPKGVMLSHFSLVANATQIKAWVNMNQSDRQLAVLPLFHGFGMSVCMNAVLISGGSIVLLPRFEAGDVLSNTHRHKPTLFAGVPTMYIALINHPKLKNYSLSSLRACYVGAAALAPEVKKQYEELTGARLMEGYGLTEAVTAICANPFTGDNKTGSIGMPFPNVIMGIRDLESGDRELPPREVGEVALQSPTLMLGYLNRPAENSQALRNGWLYTGDLGYMDEDGYFYIVDRKKDMIITGGFNVYPREVEDVLYTHPAILEASVIGVPDPYKGEIVKAYVTLKAGAEAKGQEILAFCKERLTPYKVPRQLDICAELPKTAIGKVLKRALRDLEQKEAVGEIPMDSAGIRSDSSGIQKTPPM